MPSVSRDALKKYLEKCTDPVQREIASLRLQYSEIAMLRNTFLESVRYTDRIYPTILPTQASGRWSYIKPPLSNFPKRCINPECPKGHHSRTSECWSLRDCLVPDPGTFWIEHDLDAVEHRIYALLLQWIERLNELKAGIDIHTPVTCSLFGLPLPSNANDPHKSLEDTEWRSLVHWQGKDDTRRTMSKNFTYGGQYFYVYLAKSSTYRPRLPNRIYNGLVYNPNYVFSIPNIESYKILSMDGSYVVPEYLDLAIRFVESNIDIQKRKAVLMEKCRRDKVSRTLYGGKRHAWFSDAESAKQLFNHIIQGTVASYINESCILLARAFSHDSYLVQNQHDSLKWAFRYQSTSRAGQEDEERQVLTQCKKLCERELSLGNLSIPITATFKITRRDYET